MLNLSLSNFSFASEKFFFISVIISSIGSNSSTSESIISFRTSYAATVLGTELRLLAKLLLQRCNQQVTKVKAGHVLFWHSKHVGMHHNFWYIKTTVDHLGKFCIAFHISRLIGDSIWTKMFATSTARCY